MHEFTIFFETDMAGPNLAQSAFVLIHTPPIKADSPEGALVALRETYPDLYRSGEHDPHRYLIVGAQQAVVIKRNGQRDEEHFASVETEPGNPWL